MTVRLATLEDVEQITAVHIKSGKAAYRGLMGGNTRAVCFQI